jgi:Ricin-type beta-trefoil lectin domain
MHVHKTKRTSRPLKAALLTVLVSGSMSLLGSSPALAAVLSFGNIPGNVFGGQNCADVQAGTLANGTPVNAFNCTAAPNQQFELSGLGNNNAVTIFALGGQACLDVASPTESPTPGTKVDIYICNGGNNQRWLYSAGQIMLAPPIAPIASSSAPLISLCLDGAGVPNGGFTQLVVNLCDPTKASQQWQIK